MEVTFVFHPAYRLDVFPTGEMTRGDSSWGMDTQWECLPLLDGAGEEVLWQWRHPAGQVVLADLNLFSYATRAWGAHELPSELIHKHFSKAADEPMLVVMSGVLDIEPEPPYKGTFLLYLRQFGFPKNTAAMSVADQAAERLGDDPLLTEWETRGDQRQKELAAEWRERYAECSPTDNWRLLVGEVGDGTNKASEAASLLVGDAFKLVEQQ